MRLQALCTLVILCGAPALAQDFFGNGKPPVFKEEDIDRRFAKSRIGRLLNEGTGNPHCVQIVGGLYTVLAEIGPLLHKRDETFSVDNDLVQALATQLSNPRFPGAAYLTAMVRRVQIDRQLPQIWLETAARVNERVRIIDLSKLQYLADGVRPIDSYAFTLEALRAQHELEVQRATSASATSEREFREKYLDREIAWGNLMLLDVGPEKKSRKKKGKAAVEEDPNVLVARLEVFPPTGGDDPFGLESSNSNMMKMLGPKPKRTVIRLNAKLADKQYIDLEKVPKGTRVMVRGRLWEMNKALTEFEIRDSVLFLDRDWSQGVVLADPNAVAQCPAAINELTGTASGPMQPGGFGQRK